MSDKVFSELEYAEERFSGIKCPQAEIRGRDFYDCVFTNCSFHETIFYDCKFDGCSFEACDLSLMQVTNSVFMDVQFKECQCIGINWTVADWSRLGVVEPLSFAECALSHSIFMGLPLKKIKLVKCVAENVDFADADLTETDCTHTNFLSARFNQTNLTKANFDNAVNYAIDVHQNTIKGARFSLPEAVSLLNSLGIVLVD